MNATIPLKPLRRSAAACLALLAGALLACLLTPAARAQSADSAFIAAEARIRSYVDHHVQADHPGLRYELSLGHLDRHLNLDACHFSEAYARPGTRLWGRSFIGFHCLDGASWSVSVPIQVRVYGKALVPNSDLSAQTLLDPAQFRTEEVELSAEPGPVASVASDVHLKLSMRNLEADRPVPLAALHSAPVVSQGDTVNLIARGPGFSITTDATAQGVAGEGESVRVRTENGRNLTGTAHQGRVVELVF